MAIQPSETALRATAPPLFAVGRRRLADPYARALFYSANLLVLFAIYFVSSRRHLDFSDEGFYYVNAWLAYSVHGSLSGPALLMNFGSILGAPYIFFSDVPIAAFRLLSLAAWYLAHLWFFTLLSAQLGVREGGVLSTLLSFGSLFIFLIPALSYQNMPFLFILLGICSALTVRRRLHGSPIIAMLMPVALAFATIASTPYALLSISLLPILAFVAALNQNKAAYIGFVVGVLVAAGLILMTFAPVATLDVGAAVAFLNSEVEYTSTTRFATRLAELSSFSLGPLVLGFAVAFLSSAFRPSYSTAVVLITCYVVGVAVILTPSWFRACTLTCDEAVLTVIRLALFSAPIALFCYWQNRETRFLAIVLAIFIAATYFQSLISNAPIQYNLKFSAAILTGCALFGLLYRWATPNEFNDRPYRESARLMLVLAVGLLVGQTTRILLLSSYGGANVLQHTVPLEGPFLTGLYGTPQRREMFLELGRTYAEFRCDRRFFAGVDALALPYFLFQRRPPFPHAWVATRVPASRDRLGAENDGCIMMQDRVLPGTPPDAASMIGYLRLEPERDRISLRHIGENIYLISFARQKTTEARP
jgi:hypothetical protein